MLRPEQLDERLREDQIEVAVLYAVSDTALILFQKLQQLCRLKSRQRVEIANREQTELSGPPQAPTASSISRPRLMSKGSSFQTVQRKISDDEPSAPPTTGKALVNPGKDRPDTLRIQNIPIHLTKEEVRDEVWKNFSRKPQIHSLAPTTHRESCATVTFPGAEHNFPAVKVSSDSYVEGKHKFQYDAEFDGFTPLNSPKENHAE